MSVVTAESLYDVVVCQGEVLGPFVERGEEGIWWDGEDGWVYLCTDPLAIVCTMAWVEDETGGEYCDVGFDDDGVLWAELEDGSFVPVEDDDADDDDDDDTEEVEPSKELVNAEA